jgi:putative transposase
MRMVYCIFTHFLSFLLDVIMTACMSDRRKDLELLLLRQQLRILQRKQDHPRRLVRGEKLTLAILATKLIHLTTASRSQLAQIVVMFKPDTLLKWHRELVRCKWSFIERRVSGRPRLTAELTGLILQLARENPRWGYSKIHGELIKLGYVLGRSTVRDVLKRHRVPPIPQRGQSGSNWRTFLNHYKGQILACDFFTVETVWLKTLYVLFFIELGSRRVHVAGCTATPTGAWVTQQARQLSWQIQDGALPVRFLIHDRDTKFPAAFATLGPNSKDNCHNDTKRSKGITNSKLFGPNDTQNNIDKKTKRDNIE